MKFAVLIALFFLDISIDFSESLPVGLAHRWKLVASNLDWFQRLCSFYRSYLKGNNKVCLICCCITSNLHSAWLSVGDVKKHATKWGFRNPFSLTFARRVPYSRAGQHTKGDLVPPRPGMDSDLWLGRCAHERMGFHLWPIFLYFSFLGKRMWLAMVTCLLSSLVDVTESCHLRTVTEFYT